MLSPKFLDEPSGKAERLISLDNIYPKSLFPIS